LKFSYRWLTEMVPGLSAEPASLERLITMKTAECEGIEHWQPSFPAGGEPPPQDDWVIEIDNKSLTHRPDLWGHYGMAREVAAITNNRLIDPVHMDLLPQGQPEAVSVEIEDYTLCPRYSALVFDNVTVAPSPLWLQARLLAAGLNPINNVVDVTNLILAELPQPMHAFDADKLAGHSIFVRRSRNSENIDALNGESYKLTPEDLSLPILTAQ
jgi:phenylalanyl-tRNA synthetase beta chain